MGTTHLVYELDPQESADDLQGTELLLLDAGGEARVGPPARGEALGAG